MNERISELWNEAAKLTAVLPSGNNSWETQINFIELLVQMAVRETIKEMSQQLHWQGEDQSNNVKYYKAIKKTLFEFGVEE